MLASLKKSSFFFLTVFFFLFLFPFHFIFIFFWLWFDSFFENENKDVTLEKPVPDHSFLSLPVVVGVGVVDDDVVVGEDGLLLELLLLGVSVLVFDVLPPLPPPPPLPVDVEDGLLLGLLDVATGAADVACLAFSAAAFCCCFASAAASASASAFAFLSFSSSSALPFPFPFPLPFPY